jgi:hypothetical protein
MQLSKGRVANRPYNGLVCIQLRNSYNTLETLPKFKNRKVFWHTE